MTDYEFLFRSLSIENILVVYTALMLERKIVLISSHKALLSHCSFALLSLLYPLCWPHVFIPIVPESMKTVVEAPYPFFIGLEESILLNPSIVCGQAFHIPMEVIIVDLDRNMLTNAEPYMKTLYPFSKNILTSLLEKVPFAPKISDSIRDSVDQAFNTLLIDPDEIPSFDHLAIRNIFFKYSSRIFMDFEKFATYTSEKLQGECVAFRDIFDSENFVKFKEGPKGKFYSRLVETTMFANFIEGHILGSSTNGRELKYFLELCKNNPLAIPVCSPSKVTIVFQPNCENIKENSVFQYSEFPILKLENMVKSRKIENCSDPSFIGKNQTIYSQDLEVFFIFENMRKIEK